LCGIGICVLAIWFIRGLIIRRKFRLSSSPGRRNFLNPAHVLAVLAFALLGATLAAAAARHWYPGESPAPEVLIIAGVSQSMLGLIGALLVASFAFNGGAVRGMGLTSRRWLNDSVRGVIGLLAIWPVCIGLLISAYWAIRHLASDPETLLQPHRLLEALLDPSLHWSWQILVIFSAVVLAPLGEEIFFRGLLQSMLRRYLRRPWAAILVASLFFAVAHYTVPVSLPAMFALSLALGYNYERTGRLYAPILMHALFNAVNIIDTFNQASGQA